MDVWILQSMKDTADSTIPPCSTRHLQSEPVKCSVELKQRFCITHIARKPMGSWKEKILSQPNSIIQKVMQNLFFLPDMIALPDIYEELKFLMTITHYATNMSMIFLSVEGGDK